MATTKGAESRSKKPKRAEQDQPAPKARAEKQAEPDTEEAPPSQKRPRRKKSVAAGSRGLAASVLPAEPSIPEVEGLAKAIEADGGSVLAVYRDPLGAHPVLLAGLPLERVEPTPFQRDLSETHAARLAAVLDKIGTFLDPIIAVRRPDGMYWTPNGRHRLEAMKRLGGRSLVALVLPDERVAYQILALNTEKAHNVRERALEVVRMARALAEAGTDRTEGEFAFEFEEPALITLGLCYEARPRFAGGSYHGVLRAADAFLDLPLREALTRREAQARRLVALDDRVSEIAAELKARGFESPFLKPFVIARLNPLRFRKGATMGVDEVIDRMLEAARTFDPGRVRHEQIARTGGPPLDEAA